MTKEERSKMVMDNIGLVGFTINRYYKAMSYSQDEDAYQAGCIGLIKGIESFDENKPNVAFSSYVMSFIRGELHKYMLSTLYKTQKNVAALSEAYTFYKKNRQRFAEGELNVYDENIPDSIRNLLKMQLYGVMSIDDMVKSPGSKESATYNLADNLFVEDVFSCVDSVKATKKSKEIYKDYIRLVVVGYEERKINEYLRTKYNSTRQNIFAVLKSMTKRVREEMGSVEDWR